MIALWLFSLAVTASLFHFLGYRKAMRYATRRLEECQSECERSRQ